MPITSPALSLSIEALFGAVKPTVDVLQKIGATDFSAEAPSYDIKPGATIKVPVSSIAAAGQYNAETNNYLTGGNTDWATLTATHYLQGFDISGEDIDEGVNAARMRQLFAYRAAGGISAAMAGAVSTALDALMASTAVTLSASPTLSDYIGLAADLKWLDKSAAVLVVNGAEMAMIRAVAADAHLAGDDQTIARYLGFADLALLPRMTARAVVAPRSTIGFIARVPALAVNYAESGVETDEDSGLSIGIVVADDYAKNRRVVDADLWFGVTTVSAPAGATTAGAIKVGTGA